MLAIPLLAIALTCTANQDSARSAKTEDGPSIVSIIASASGWLASFDGTLQTPTGGAAGTTSHRRPTTSEIGLRGANAFAFADLELRFFERHTLHISYTALSQRGSGTLDQALVSQGQTFPSNAHVVSRLEIPIGRVGYRAHWLPLSFRGWSLSPEIGVASLDFRYRLRSDDATGPVDRAYELYFGYLGFQLQGPISGRLRGEFDLFASAGISNVTSLDSDLRLVYLIAENDCVSASLLAGLRGIWLHYKDDQKAEQNRIDVRTGAYSTRPWAGAHLGLRLSY